MTPEKIKTALPPVGVKIVKSGETTPAGEAYSGISYCEAVHRATSGEKLLVLPGSVTVCRWSPPILGLKDPESDFEKEREPGLPFRAEGIFLARLDDWPEGMDDPDVVVVRAEREEMRKLVTAAGPGRTFSERDGIDITVVPSLTGEKPGRLNIALIGITNRMLGALTGFRLWDAFTVWAFRREWTSRILNFVLDRAMANMSMCRNSTVVPYLSGRLNVSHFCTGGITWGKNPPHLMTAGMPYPLYVEIFLDRQ